MKKLLIIFCFFITVSIFAYAPYSSSKQYNVGDIVTYNSKDYISVNSTWGNPPTSTWYWSIYTGNNNSENGNSQSNSVIIEKLDNLIYLVQVCSFILAFIFGVLFVRLAVLAKNQRNIW